VNECGVPGTVVGVHGPYGTDTPAALDRLDGSTPAAGRGSTRAELLTAVAGTGTRGQSAATAPASGEAMTCDAATPGGSPPSVAGACRSVCAVADGAGSIGGIDDAKLGATDGATPALTGHGGHLSSVMSSYGRQTDKRYASESAVGSPLLTASSMDVCR